MKTITFQGVTGAFSHITAVEEFGEQNHFIGSETFLQVFENLESGRAEYAVIPIENSLVGSIYENYDLLNQYDTTIIGERFTRIEHCLMSIPTSEKNCEKRIKQLTTVFSHPKALEQCTQFFKDHPWLKATVYVDTAAAAADIAEKEDPTQAAIASAGAGDLYHLDILARGIEDDPKNYTRFITITKDPEHNLTADKCSLLIKLHHVPGALAQVLVLFANEGFNLTKVESRPIKGQPFEYLFYIDFEFDPNKRGIVENLLHSLLDKVQLLKILGFYKKGSLWNS